jgi:nicotinamidase-related amidase
MSTALLIIDIQNDYFPGGAMELVEPASAAAQAARLLQAFREKTLPVFHVRHLAIRAGATFFVPDTAGAAIHESVSPIEGETILTKHFPNSFRDTGLHDALQAANVTNLVIVGMMTHMCVDTSVRVAAELGYTCWLAQDGCATRDLTFGGRRVAADAVQLAYLAALHGSFATVAPAADLCATL